LSRPELIKQLKQKNPKLNQYDLETVINVFCEEIERALKNGKKVELRGFGTFFVKKIKEKHSARNPKTGELIYVPEKNKVRFRTSKKLKKLINE
jgi:integration host factor subunit beta